MTTKKGVLLINLGSPDSTSVDDVRRYLREFLSDSRVLDGPKIQQQAVLNLFILPSRPKETAAAYKLIWSKEGSPLIVTTYKQRDLLAERIDMPIAVGMRYGNPSTRSAIEELKAKGVTEALVIPLYPHYTQSSFETAVAKAQEEAAEVAPNMKLTFQMPFYNDPDYIGALVAAAEEQLKQDYDHILFSYHGIPERHLRNADASGCYCLQSSDCCEKPNPMHSMCYRSQVFATSHAFAKKAGIPREKYSVSFQSRLGKDPWLQPFTDVQFAELPKKGVKKLLVISPAFVADNLETLEELGMRGREDFLKAGGTDYHVIPCVNVHPRWIDTLEKFVHNLAALNP